jgi:hypothetical protein
LRRQTKRGSFSDAMNYLVETILVMMEIMLGDVEERRRDGRVEGGGFEIFHLDDERMKSK